MKYSAMYPMGLIVLCSAFLLCGVHGVEPDYESFLVRGDDSEAPALAPSGDDSEAPGLAPDYASVVVSGDDSVAPPGAAAGLASDYDSWSPGHATFYGGADASGTAGGACGYQNPFTLGYGEYTAAVSDMIYDGGLVCGACFEVKCDGDPACFSSSVVVTATNESPQYSTATPGPHFDLSQPAFNMIGQEIAGHFVIQYRRVACEKQGGVKFMISGQTYWMNVFVYNVGGAGDVQSLSVKGSNTDWIQLQHTWGQNWSTGSILDGQAISFFITTSDGKTLYSYNVGDSSWQYGHTYEGGQF